MPIIKPRPLCRALTRLGFVLKRQRGSHAVFRHADGRTVVIPMHPDDLPPGTLRGILDDLSLTIEELKKVL